MKAVTVELPDVFYSEFEMFARKVNRKTPELIREAMELYRQQYIHRSASLRDRRPAIIGAPIRPITAGDDILGEMLDDMRD